MAVKQGWTVSITEGVWLTSASVAVKTKDGRWMAKAISKYLREESQNLKKRMAAMASKGVDWGGGEVRPLTAEEELLLAERLFKEKSA